MLFDVKTALAEILNSLPATSATSATRPSRKASVSQMSRMSQPQSGENGNPDFDEWRDLYEERAAIAKHDGGLSRQEAEALARAEVTHLSRGETLPTHPATCAVCGATDWRVCARDAMGRTFHVRCWRAVSHQHSGD